MLCWLAFGDHEALKRHMKRARILIPAEGKPTIPSRRPYLRNCRNISMYAISGYDISGYDISMYDIFVHDVSVYDISVFLVSCVSCVLVSCILNILCLEKGGGG